MVDEGTICDEPESCAAEGVELPEGCVGGETCDADGVATATGVSEVMAAGLRPDSVSRFKRCRSARKSAAC